MAYWRKEDIGVIKALLNLSPDLALGYLFVNICGREVPRSAIHSHHPRRTRTSCHLQGKLNL